MFVKTLLLIFLTKYIMTCDWNNVCELVHNLINEKTKVAGHM